MKPNMSVSNDTFKIGKALHIYLFKSALQQHSGVSESPFLSAVDTPKKLELQQKTLYAMQNVYKVDS